MAVLKLRKASEKDMKLLYNWANDSEVRAASFQTHEITMKEHETWFHRQMESESCDIFIAEAKKDEIINKDRNRKIEEPAHSAAVGQTRFSYENGNALISYSIAAEARGRGYAGEMISLALSKIREERPDITTFLAEVKNENLASQKVFEKRGFSKVKESNFVTYKKVICRV